MSEVTDPIARAKAELETDFALSLDTGNALVAEAERLARAARTRPDYDIRCSQCGASHWVDTSIPSELWNQIAEAHDILCALCIDDRLAAKGLRCDDAEFYYVGAALSSSLYARDANDRIRALEAELAEWKGKAVRAREDHADEKDLNGVLIRERDALKAENAELREYKFMYEGLCR